MSGDVDPSHSLTNADDLESGPLESAGTQLFRLGQAALDSSLPLLGQDKALAALRTALQQAFTGHQAQWISFCGPRGSGRTRLLIAASELAAQGWIDVRVLYAACRPHEDGPYAPFSRALLERFSVSPASSPARVRAEMAQEIAQALGAREQARLTEVTHLLGHIAGIPFRESPFLQTDKDGVAHLLPRAADALRDFLAHDAQQRPLLVLLDDLRPDAVDALTMLNTLQGVEAPLLVVVAGSQEFSELQQATCPEVALHMLNPLSSEHIGELTRLFVPGLVEATETFFDALQIRTKGNPAALHELLQALGEAGLFRPNGEGLELDLDRLSASELPLDMDAAIHARLSQLTPDEQRTMAYASVVGERFWDGAVIALWRSEPDQASENQDTPLLQMFERSREELQVHDALEQLQHKRFVVRLSHSASPGLVEYTFQYAGTRTLLYRDLPESARQRYHGVVAAWLSSVRGLESLSALVAPHLARAGMPDQAARAYVRAAYEERRRKRTTMARRLIDKALPLLSDKDIAGRLEVLHARGSLLTVVGRYDEAETTFVAMFKEAYRIGARGRAGAALNRIARIYRQRGELNQSIGYLYGALSLFRTIDDERGVASTYDDLAQLHRLRGESEEAVAAANEALDIRVRIHDERGQATSLNTIANLELDRGRLDEAGSRFQVALEIRNRLQDHEGAIQTQIGVARIALQRGMLVEAIERFRGALDEAREMDNQRFQSYLLCGLGEAYTLAGSNEDARVALEEARTLASALRDQRALCDVHRLFGLLALQTGDEAAKPLLQAALALAEQYGARQPLALAHRALARLHSHTVFTLAAEPGEVGNNNPQTDHASVPMTALDNAEDHYAAAIDNFALYGAEHEVARTESELGLHLFERGRADEARAILARALPGLIAFQLRERHRVEAALAELARERLETPSEVAP